MAGFAASVLIASVDTGAVSKASVGAAAKRAVNRGERLGAPIPGQRASATGAPEPLFMQAAGTAASAPSELVKLAIRRTTLTVSDRALQNGLMSAEAYLLNLFPDVQIVAMRSRVESRSVGNYSWFGYVPGDDFGRAIIAVVRGKLGILVTTARRRYVVLPSSDGRYDALEFDNRAFGDLDDDVVPTQTVNPGRVEIKGSTRSTTTLTTNPVDTDGLVRFVPWDFVAGNGGLPKFGSVRDLGNDIDVLVVYTHDAAWRAGGGLINSWHSLTEIPYGLLVDVQLAVDTTNQSFMESGVPIHLNVVGDPLEDPAYHENGQMAADLDAIRDGLVANVYVEREVRAADLVVFVTSGGKSSKGHDSCGLSPTRELDASSNEAYAAARAYFVVKYSCLVNYTLAHEIGHQLGAAHDWYSVGIEGTPNVVSYAHGYSWVNGPATFGFYTIMATDRKCKDFVSTYIQYGLNCPQVGRWSDPSATDSSGEPLGSVTPMPSHDARAITENRIAVANYRLSACRLLDC